LNIEILNQYFY